MFAFPLLARNAAAAVAAYALFMVVLIGVATAKTPFNAAAFDAAQAQGKTILVEVSAPWCPVCRQQKPIIESLMGKPEFKNAVLFVVDFDTQKDAFSRLGVQRQATLIAFKGKDEKGRSTFDTNAQTIGSLFRSAL
ncbi:MAG: thioredoxin family protein [Alphaproteobacteria bacterium]|nr:thioredoxin family protein [Alphaproteobacteria bacterium]